MNRRILKTGKIVAVHRNDGLRKLCDCGRRRWPRCVHAWYFNFKPRHGRAFRFSLDMELGRHIATKTDAETEAAKIKAAILGGSFVRASDRRQVEPPPATTADAIRLESFGEKFVAGKSEASGKESWKNDRYMFAQLASFVLADGTRLGAKRLGAITEDDLEAFHTHLRAIGRAASTRNQYVQLLKSSFRWAVKKSYLARSPISEDSTLKRTKVAKRHRRLAAEVLDKNGGIKQPGEERRLLAKAGERLQRLIIAALETGCRRGELLNLQWRDVDLKRGELHIRAENAKDGDDRLLPISSRLKSVLDMAKTDPAGNEYPPHAFVFGELGERVANIKRAWETAVLKAHGHEPRWTKGTLAAESRAALRAIDLHFHDLRHEAGSRWLEAGWPLHKVRDMLGHATIDQTDTYLSVERLGLHDEMRRFDGTRCNLVAKPSESELPAVGNDTHTVDSNVTVN